MKGARPRPNKMSFFFGFLLRRARLTNVGGGVDKSLPPKGIQKINKQTTTCFFNSRIFLVPFGLL